MSAGLSPDEALRQVPGFRVGASVVSRLSGGLTNRSYLVVRGGERYVLRLDDVHTGSFGIDRAAERRARALAASAGLTAAVVFEDMECGILLTEYLRGGPLQPADLREPATLAAVANLLQAVHALPLIGRRFDAESAAEAYLSALYDAPPFATQCLQIIRSCPAASAISCCHNDVVAANIVAGEKLVLIDWEYAADNDPMFDLASLVCFHDLGKRQIDILLARYAGADAAIARERLAAQMRIYDALHWLWLAVRLRHSPARRFRARLDELQERLQKGR